MPKHHYSLFLETRQPNRNEQYGQFYFTVFETHKIDRFLCVQYFEHLNYINRLPPSAQDNSKRN